MSKNSPIEGAAEIIDRFGGIRPMASKIDVAVTTIQGWKKRDAIPANRYKQIVSAAEAHDVDLSGLIDVDATANTNTARKGVSATKASDAKPATVSVETPATEDRENETVEPDFLASMKVADESEIPASFIASMLHDDMIQLIARSERRAVLKSTWTTIFLIVLTVGAAFVLLWPKAERMSEANRVAEMERINALEAEIESLKGDVEGVKNRQGFFGRIIPEDLNERLDDLQGKAQDLQSKAEEMRDGALSAVDEVRTLSTELIDGRTQALQERMVALEQQLAGLSSVPLMSALTQRYEAFTASAGGQDLLQATTGELSSLLMGSGNADKPVDEVLDEARQASPVLGQSFEGVPQQDLKAAALLLTMTQLRSTLNRPGESFADDLGLLRNLVGEDDTALIQSINKLAPHASQGVLTPAGLSDELKSLTGDIVVASLKGEDVSVGERAKARLNNLFQIEKDGELVTGTPTQAAVVQAQNALQSGDLEAAIAQIEGLDGAAAQAAAPWLNQAKATLVARELKNALSGVLASSAAGIKNYTAGGVMAPSEMIVDPVTGMRVLKRQSTGQNNLPSLPDM